MNKMEALRMMLNGKKVCANKWTNQDDYLEVKGDMIYSSLSEDGEGVFNSWSFNLCDEWKEYIPPYSFPVEVYLVFTRIP